MATTMDEKKLHDAEADGVSASSLQDASKSAPSTDELAPIDPVADAALMRKVDKFIVPFMVVMYLFSFLDRVNIGNAKLNGMEEDLGLVGDQFQIAVSILFVPYCVSSTPTT